MGRIRPDEDICYVPSIWPPWPRGGKTYTMDAMHKVGYMVAMSRPTRSSVEALLVRIDKEMVDDKHFSPTVDPCLPRQMHPLEQMKTHAEAALKDCRRRDLVGKLALANGMPLERAERDWDKIIGIFCGDGD